MNVRTIIFLTQVLIVSICTADVPKSIPEKLRWRPNIYPYASGSNLLDYRRFIVTKGQRSVRDDIEAGNFKSAYIKAFSLAKNNRKDMVSQKLFGDTAILSGHLQQYCDYMAAKMQKNDGHILSDVFGPERITMQEHIALANAVTAYVKSKKLYKNTTGPWGELTPRLVANLIEGYYQPGGPTQPDRPTPKTRLESVMFLSSMISEEGTKTSGINGFSGLYMKDKTPEAFYYYVLSRFWQYRSRGISSPWDKDFGKLTLAQARDSYKYLLDAEKLEPKNPDLIYSIACMYRYSGPYMSRICPLLEKFLKLVPNEDSWRTKGAREALKYKGKENEFPDRIAMAIYFSRPGIFLGFNCE